MKYTIISLITFIAFLCTTFANKHETWKSSVGSTINGVFIGSTDSEHWIASSTGRLFKLSKSALSEESIQRIDELNETKKKRESMQHIKHSDLMPLDHTSVNEKLITTLCSTKIPSVNFEATPISSALESLNEIAGTGITFRLEGEAADRNVNIALRNLYMNQMLDFLTQQVGLYYRVENGEIVIRNQHR